MAQRRDLLLSTFLLWRDSVFYATVFLRMALFSGTLHISIMEKNASESLIELMRVAAERDAACSRLLSPKLLNFARHPQPRRDEIIVRAKICANEAVDPVARRAVEDLLDILYAE